LKVILSQSYNPVFNLAFEEYLFDQTGDNFLLFYRNSPCVIIGSNQAVENEVNLDYCHKLSIPVIRRKSGGGAVYHDLGNLNYSFIFHKPENELALSADFLHKISNWLLQLGVNTKIGKRKDLWLPNDTKISGTASRVQRSRIMNHGTLLLDADLICLQNTLSPIKVNNQLKATRSVQSKTSNIKELFPPANFNVNAFVNMLVEIAAGFYESKIWSDVDFSQSEISNFELTYIDEGWNFKK
jgi:lipoate---protein ligase